MESKMKKTLKRKREGDEESVRSPKHPLLDSVANRFKLNKADRERKMTEYEAKREAELAHSKYIKRNVADPVELRKANETVKYWVNRNGLKGAPILGIRLNQRSGTSSSSRLDNQSYQRSGISKNSTTASSPNGNQTENTENRLIEEENSRYPSNTASTRAESDRSTFRANTLDNVIDLDTTHDESIDCIEVLDCSNNSNPCPNSPSSSSQRKYITRQTARHVCAVLNCEAVFESEGALGHHKNLFKHSPCNPCLKAKDCKILPDPQCYMCPDCDKEFQSADTCRNHMRSSFHMTFLPPLSITSYMCAHCLYVFNTYQSCWEHIEEAQHRDISYPFVDDHGDNSSGGIGPVPLAEELLQDFIQKCGKVAFKINCLECSMDLENPAVLRHHMLETNNQHLVSTLADTNLVDVFASYLAGYTCDTCHRLFNGGMKELAKHQCSQRIIGTIIENNTRSFTEFIKRCALSIIKSEETQRPELDNLQPGPSNIVTVQSPNRRLRKSSIIVIDESPPRKSDDNLDLTEDLMEDNGVRSRSLITGDKLNNNKQATEEKSIKELSKEPASSQSASNAPKNLKLSNEDNKLTSKQSKRKKTRWDQGTVDNTPNNEPTVDENANDCLMAPITLDDFNALKSQNMENSSVQSTFLSQIDFTVPPPQIPSAKQKNFYCHPPPPNKPRGPSVRFVNPLPGQPRYPLRNQNNAQSNQRSGNINIRIAEKTGRPFSTKDIQVAGSSKEKSLASNTTPMDQSSDGPSLKRDRSPSPIISKDYLISIENLTIKKNIVFLDLDNWAGFFSRLPRVLPDGAFVWGFYGGRRVWREPYKCYIFDQMKLKGQFYLNERCGYTKDAADFAIVLSVGKMDALLPTNVAFTILSGDTGFFEVERQMRMSKRKAVVINPHKANYVSTEMIYTMVTSVTDT